MTSCSSDCASAVQVKVLDVQTVKASTQRRNGKRNGKGNGDSRRVLGAVALLWIRGRWKRFHGTQGYVLPPLVPAMEALEK